MTPDRVHESDLHTPGLIGSCMVCTGQWPCVTAQLEAANAEIGRLRGGIVRYMDDPPCAADCASLDPYPARGACDCGVQEFVKSAAPAATEEQRSERQGI